MRFQEIYQTFVSNYIKNDKAPTEGIEPSTYGLEVHRAIHCAMRAYIT